MALEHIEELKMHIKTIKENCEYLTYWLKLGTPEHITAQNILNHIIEIEKIINQLL